MQFLRRNSLPLLIGAGVTLFVVAIVVGVADLARNDDASHDRRVTIGAAQFDLDELRETLESLDLGDLDFDDPLDSPAIAALIEALRGAFGEQFSDGFGGFEFFGQSTDSTPALGVTVEDREGHLMVAEVLSGSAAASAGIERGDELLSVAGDSVGTVPALREAVERALAGGEFEVDVRRDGRRVTLDVDPATAAASRARSQLRDLADRFSESFQGQLTPGGGGRTPERVPGRSEVQSAQPSATQLGVLATDTAGGVRVTEVQRGSGAAQARLQPGDLIVAVEGVPTPSVAALRERLSGFAAADFVSVTVRRDREVMLLSVALIPPAASARIVPGGTPGSVARPGSGQTQQQQNPFGALLNPDAAASAATEALLERLADLVAERLASRGAVTPDVTPTPTPAPAATASEPAADLTAFFGRVVAIDGESLRLDGTQGGISLVLTDETLRLGFKDAANGDLVTVVVSDGVVQMLIVVG
ncbi:MAG TPA: PDZ domain-containing protein [Dehalococcoidia bacterium]|nr:PDZ domain-containing protein [Dehalococcoidia bacterium]